MLPSEEGVRSMPPSGLHEWCLRSYLFAAGVDVPKEGLEEVEIRRGCDCLGRLTGRDVLEKISFPLEESDIV